MIKAPDSFVDENGKPYFKYESLEVRKITLGGIEQYGVFVEIGKRLDPGVLIPMGGIPLRQQDFDALKKNPNRNLAAYLIENDPEEGEVKYRYDCHPRHFANKTWNGAKGAQFAWIGALVNTPGEGEAANCSIEAMYAPLTDNRYPYTKSPFFVMTKAVIAGGTQLTVNYRYSTTVAARRGIPTKIVQSDDEDSDVGKKGHRSGVQVTRQSEGSSSNAPATNWRADAGSAGGIAKQKNRKRTLDHAEAMRNAKSAKRDECDSDEEGDYF